MTAANLLRGMPSSSGSGGKEEFLLKDECELIGNAAVVKVERLLAELESNLESAKLSLKELETMLGEVKVLGRDIANAGPIFTEKGVKVLSSYGLDQKRSLASLEALRCLANTFLLHEASRQTFVDLGFAPKACEKLKADNHDDEFVISRILFLLTYNTNVDFESLVQNNQLADTMNTNISRHAKMFSSKSGRRKSDASPMVDRALTETLKLTFNITYYYPELVGRFTPSIEHLVGLILNHPLPNPPLQSPITHMLNALLNLDIVDAEKKTPLGPQARLSPLFPHSTPEALVERLTTIFNKAMMQYSEKELDQAAAPLCTLVRRLYALAYPQTKEWMQWVMLPSDSDRNKPLGQGDTMVSRLLRCSCSPGLPTLRDNISSLLFELSGSDANKFVSNIGYGFASGFLMSHNIDIPVNAAEASSISTDASNEASRLEVNPITGQLRSAEEKEKQAANEPEMSEEEKEREAEKLFVLFERLKATGVIDVKNPVQQAMEDGRFEEVD